MLRTASRWRSASASLNRRDGVSNSRSPSTASRIFTSSASCSLSALSRPSTNRSTRKFSCCGASSRSTNRPLQPLSATLRASSRTRPCNSKRATVAFQSSSRAWGGTDAVSVSETARSVLVSPVTALWVGAATVPGPASLGTAPTDWVVAACRVTDSAGSDFDPKNRGSPSAGRKASMRNSTISNPY